MAELAAAELSSRQGEGRERRAGPVLRGHPGRREGGREAAAALAGALRALPRGLGCLRTRPRREAGAQRGRAAVAQTGAPGKAPIGPREGSGCVVVTPGAGGRPLRGSVDGDIATRAGRACACSVAFWCVISCP